MNDHENEGNKPPQPEQSLENSEFYQQLSETDRAALDLGLLVGSAISLRDQVIKASPGYEQRQGQREHSVQNPLDEGKAAPLFQVEVHYGYDGNSEADEMSKKGIRFANYTGSKITPQMLFTDILPPKSDNRLEVDNEKGKGHINAPLGVEVALIEIPEGMTWDEARQKLEASGYQLPDMQTAFNFIMQCGGEKTFLKNERIALTDSSPKPGPRRFPLMAVADIRSNLEGEITRLTLELDDASREQMDLDAILAVYEPEEIEYSWESPDKEDISVMDAKKRLSTAKSIIESGYVSPQLLKGTHQLLESLAGHEDETVSSETLRLLQKISMNISDDDFENNDDKRESWYFVSEQIGLAFGVPQDSVAVTAAEILVKMDDGNRTGFNIINALAHHGDKIKGRAALALFEDALDRISSSAPPVWYGGHDRDRINSGYEIISRMLGSNDYETASVAYGFLHSAISGGEQLTEGEKRAVTWLTEMDFKSENKDDTVWQTMRDTFTARKFTHKTEESYRAMRNFIANCPHEDLRRSAEADIVEHEKLVSDMQARGVYMQFD